MIPLEAIVIFVSASAVLGLAPGPDNVFVLTQSALYGRLAGVVVTLGLCTGLIVHTAAVALGVATLFQASATAFTLLKIVGASYLLFLAWQAFRASASTMSHAADTTIGLARLYRRGIIMNVTNPKVAIFFLAFLPQFADPQQGPIAVQIMAFGGLFIGVTAIVFGLIAWSAGYLGEWLQRSDRAQKVLNRIAGTVFIALALKLATTER